jgi:hypothetical protein
MTVDSNVIGTRERRAENPGVGGSIPSQPTILSSPAFNDLARVARTRRACCARLTRRIMNSWRPLAIVLRLRRELLQKWGRLHGVRSVLSILATVLMLVKLVS